MGVKGSSWVASWKSVLYFPYSAFATHHNCTALAQLAAGARCYFCIGTAGSLWSSFWKHACPPPILLQASVASGFTASGIDPSMFDQAFLAGPPQQAQHARRGSAGGMPPRQASAADLQRSLSRPGLAHWRSRSAGVGMGRSASISDVSGQGGAATAAIAGSAAGTAGTAGSAGGSSGNLLTMTAYEREMYEAEAPQQAQQGAGHAGLPGAAAVRQAVAEASLNWGNRYARVGGWVGLVCTMFPIKNASLFMQLSGRRCTAQLGTPQGVLPCIAAHSPK